MNTFNKPIIWPFPSLRNYIIFIQILTFCTENSIQARAWHNLNDMCTQGKLRSAWAHGLSDQIYTVHAMGRLRSNEYIRRQRGLISSSHRLCGSSNLENCHWLVLYFVCKNSWGIFQNCMSSDFFSDFIFKINFISVIFQLYNLCIKQFGSRSGLTF